MALMLDRTSVGRLRPSDAYPVLSLLLPDSQSASTVLALAFCFREWQHLPNSAIYCNPFLVAH